MAKIGCLKPFRGSANALANVVLEDGEIAFETTNKRIYIGNGVDPISSLTSFINNGTTDISSIGDGSITGAINTINSKIGIDYSSQTDVSPWITLTTVITDIVTMPYDGAISCTLLVGSHSSASGGVTLTVNTRWIHTIRGVEGYYDSPIFFVKQGDVIGAVKSSDSGTSQVTTYYLYRRK